MRKLIIVDEKDVYKYDAGAIKRNEQAPIYFWKNSDDERTLLKLLRKYDYLVIIGDKYLYESLEILKEQKPFSLYNFELKYLDGKFYEKYTLRNNLGKYLYEALNKTSRKRGN